ncbi:MAG: 2-octaprenyl-6-methoxyphenyl hydroxylase [Pseudomonadota bacterium]
MSERYDVVIAGAGLVGASLALALARLNWRVAVLERAPFREVAPPTYDDRTLALSLASRNILSAIGLWDGLERQPEDGSTAGVTPIRSVQVTQKGGPGLVTIRAQEEGLDALGYVVQARRLGEHVLKTLPGCPGVDLLVPCEVTDVEADAGEVRVSCTLDGSDTTIATQLLVGADGTASRVRDAIKIPSERYDYDQTAIIANVTPQEFHEGRAFERMTDTGPLAMLPHVERRCGVVWCCRSADAEAILAMSDREFLAAVQERFGYRLGHLERVGVRASYPLARLTVPSPVARRSVIIGNAAHTIHPVAAQGFNLGLRDVAALTELLTEAAASGDDPGSETLLQTYADWREPDVSRTVAFTDGMVRAFSQSFGPVALARSVGLLALQLAPGLRGALAHRGMGFGGQRPPAMALAEATR